MRLSSRCKILFTLGLFANYFSLKSLSLSLKSQMNVLCALKLTEKLWNTSLLFDSNYKLNILMGASLLALAKSIYYFECRRGSFRAAVDHCRSFRLLITTFVSITPRGFIVCYICYEICHLLH